MKYKLQFLVSLFLCFIINSIGFAQYITNGVIQDGTSSNLQGLISSINNDNNSDIEGSPYINETYQLAKISSIEENNLSVRYNGFNDQFEIKGDNEKVYLLNKSLTNLTIQFLNSNKRYKTYNYFNDKTGNRSIGYFVVLSQESEIILLKKESINYIEGKKSVTSYERDKPSKFRRNSDKYFFLMKENDLKNFPNNKKDIANLFPAYSNNILNYIKSNQIKTTDDEDLIQLVVYINTLLKQKNN